ncbi:MAG: hypothetical protein A2201_02800 [Alicyclobacillus sp. RIFOXYA1_FULL_53_8]|nr:MAG: hypothetical protein A2201_02800 [Alicyclobacillus sp. RIFOXYA1_FULL_53_8]
MFEGGSLWAGVVSGGYSQLQDTVALSNGKMQRNEYAVNSAKNVTGALGTMAGVEYGAILGTVIMPGVGTTLGSILGGLAGDRLGRLVGGQAGNVMFSSQTANHNSLEQRQLITSGL